ncbi:unnamed protein product [Effrenium voratum]|nr:unnamed protein product [Effrenium voratum]
MALDFLASAHSSTAPQLINMLTRMVAEECLGQASVSCSVERHAAVGGMLLEALVAHVAQHCTQKAPGLAQLFQLLESILEAFGAAPAALDTLSRSLESSSPVLAALVSVPDDGSGGGLLLRLAERGGKELSPHLARESRRLAHSLAEAQPGSQLATTLLALYRMCALHPELFESLLSGDLTAHAESIAVGLSRHLACEVSALRLAAAELAEDFAAFFEGAVEGWMRKAHLAQWLVEACRRGEDLGARAAACRALGRLDEPRLQTAAADALMDACSFALSVTAPVGEKRQVLQMAAESLSRCPGSGAFAPQQLVAILRAAVDTEGDLLEDCLEPVYFCVTHRPMDSEMSISCLAELLDATTALARQASAKLQQLAAAPAGALQHSPVLAILLDGETAALAHFRAWDVPRLRELDLGQLEGVDQSQHDPETEELHGDAVAWAQLASSLLALRASKPKLPNEPDWARPADGPTTAFRLLTLSACLLRCPAVLGMQCSGSLLRGFADLICAETAQGGCPDAVDWSVCVTNAAALAILGLLGSDISHPLNRSETLHSEKVARSLQSAVERLLDFQSEGGTVHQGAA